MRPKQPDEGRNGDENGNLNGRNEQDEDDKPFYHGVITHAGKVGVGAGIVYGVCPRQFAGHIDRHASGWLKSHTYIIALKRARFAAD